MDIDVWLCCGNATYLFRNNQRLHQNLYHDDPIYGNKAQLLSVAHLFYNIYARTHTATQTYTHTYQYL